MVYSLHAVVSVLYADVLLLYAVVVLHYAAVSLLYADTMCGIIFGSFVGICNDFIIIVSLLFGM